MSSNSDLHQFLKQVAGNQADIRLLNVYKGLPISYAARISSVGDSEIQVHSNRYQLACLYYQRETYLQVQALPSVLRSQVVSLHLGKEDATLTNLEVAGKSIGSRSQIRVEPDQPLRPRSIQRGSHRANCSRCRYFCGRGWCFSEPYMFSPRLCQPGNSVSVSITLPDTVSQKIKKSFAKPLKDIRTTGALHPDASIDSAGTVVITTTGKITSVRSELVQFRLGLRLYFKDLSRTVVLQYISQRQSEIIRDLSILTDDLYNRKR